ncbi:hypothetical protein JHW43_006518 [Diplocarpon mali]|nr:hypothetical protein JHW43_006518 [Diplocarpon mali]
MDSVSRALWTRLVSPLVACLTFGPLVNRLPRVARSSIRAPRPSPLARPPRRLELLASSISTLASFLLLDTVPGPSEMKPKLSRPVHTAGPGLRARGCYSSSSPPHGRDELTSRPFVIPALPVRELLVTRAHASSPRPRDSSSAPGRIWDQNIRLARNFPPGR